MKIDFAIPIHSLRSMIKTRMESVTISALIFATIPRPVSQRWTSCTFSRQCQRTFPSSCIVSDLFSKDKVSITAQCAQERMIREPSLMILLSPISLPFSLSLSLSWYRLSQRHISLETAFMVAIAMGQLCDALLPSSVFAVCALYGFFCSTSLSSVLSHVWTCLPARRFAGSSYFICLTL